MITPTRSSSGWTGGQYSLLRLTFALSALSYAGIVWLGGEEGSLAQRWTATLLMALMALPLALGFLDRLAALALALALLLHRFLLPSPEFLVSWPAFESLLILHLFVPTAPYGSLKALGRASPAGDWHLPDALYDLAWLVVGITHLLAGVAAFGALAVWTELFDLEHLSILLHVSVLPLALFPGARKLAFVVGVLALALGPWDAEVILALTAHLACLSPAWIPGSSPEKELLFYDGECGLCHRAVRFCLAEDHEGSLWSYAPLDSDVFRARISEDARAALPDSIIVLTPQGEVLSQSTAVLRCLSRLGGIWRVAALVMALVPARVRDAIYRGIAKVRHRLFSPPSSQCPLVPESLRNRFLFESEQA